MAVDLWRISQKNVFWFEVTMNDAFLVKILQSSNYLSKNDSRIKFRHIEIMAIYESP